MNIIVAIIFRLKVLKNASKYTISKENMPKFF